MPKEIIADGVVYKLLPYSSYYISEDGRFISVRFVLPDKRGCVRLVRKGKRVTRSAAKLVDFLWPKR